MTEPDLITQAEAANLLEPRGVSFGALRSAINDGRIPTTARYGKQLVRRSDVLKVFGDGPRRRGRKPVP